MARKFFLRNRVKAQTCRSDQTRKIRGSMTRCDMLEDDMVYSVGYRNLCRDGSGPSCFHTPLLKVHQMGPHALFINLLIG